MSDVAVVIVNYNAGDLVIAAVESVLDRSHGARRVEVHVVDNASPRGCADVLTEAHRSRGWADRVVLHLEATNHGFGRGNNVALAALAERASPPDHVFFLNPDARLTSSAVERLAAFLDEHPRAAAVGAQVEAPGGELVASAFRFHSLASTFASAVSFGPISRLFRASEVPLPPSPGPRRVDWVTGAAFMARREALEAVGRFDPAFFLYFEETDLMRRLSAAGWEVWHDPSAVVCHDEGAVTGLAGAKAERRPLPPYWYESWRLYFERSHGRGGALAAAALWLIGAAANQAISALRGRPARTARNFYADFWAYGLRPLLGLRARDYGR